MIKGITIDNTTYDVAAGITRRARVVSSNNSGMLMNGDYYNDVLGTAYDYTVTIAVPKGKETQYALMYQALTNPVAYHTFLLPYNQTSIFIKGRIEQVVDSYVKTEGAVKLWRATKFTIISNEFQR